MIYEINTVGLPYGFVIAGRGGYLPGAYTTKRAANYAFRFSDSEIAAVPLDKDGQITFEALQAFRKSHPRSPK